MARRNPDIYWQGNKYEINTSACYTGIISGKLNSVDMVKT